MLAEITVDTIKLFPSFQSSASQTNWKVQRSKYAYQPQLILLDNFFTRWQGIDLIHRTISTNYTGRIIFITAI